jgi:hypothetical protein
MMKKRTRRTNDFCVFVLQERAKLKLPPSEQTRTKRGEDSVQKTCRPLHPDRIACFSTQRDSRHSTKNFKLLGGSSEALFESKVGGRSDGRAVTSHQLVVGVLRNGTN